MAETGSQKSVSPKYTIHGNTLKTLGFSFELKNAAIYLKEIGDGSFYVELYKSPNKKMAVLSLGSGETREPYRDLWLIDFEHNKTELLDETGGSFTSVFWHTNNLFEITWGGMGYEMSVFVKLGKNRQQAHVDDLLDIDVQREVYVDLGLINQPGECLEVGSLFKKEIQKEQFVLPPMEGDSLYVSHLPKLEIEGKKLVVCFDKSGDGEKIERLVFYPKILK